MEGRLENENLLRTSAGAPWWPAIYLNLRTLTSCHGVPVSSRLCRVADPSRQSATGHKGRPRRRRWWPFAHSNECDGIHHRWELSQIRLAICSMLPTLCLVDPSRPYGCTACCFTGSIVSSRDSLAARRWLTTTRIWYLHHAGVQKIRSLMLHRDLTIASASRPLVGMLIMYCTIL
jgi:hypothetical protein